jgi:anti-sigma28 factor (negative regulator of flagellin synthesis)
MRLHLDSSVSGASDAAPTAAGSSSTRNGARGLDTSASRDSSSVSGASSALNQLSAQRSARIEELSAAVQSGRYRVSSSALSGAILGHAVS